MKGWRERAADIFAKHGEIAAKMKSAPGPLGFLPSAATRTVILFPPTPPPSPMPRPCNRNYPTLLAPLSLTNSFRCERRVIAMAQ